MSLAVASGWRRRSASAFITMPGEQNPHCEAPVRAKASAHEVRVASDRPSSVSTVRPATRVAGCAQETTA